ncbi:MAG: hypothetical protein OHK0052_15880 [Anaerolineales bacterium]
MKAKRELALVLVVLSLAALACNAAQNLPRVVVVYPTPKENVPPPTPESGSQKPGGGGIAPQPNGDPTLGLNRARPFPYASVAHAPDWDYEVLEVLRGNQAWQVLREANMFNEPPPEGREYLLLRLRVTNSSRKDQEVNSGDYFLTGDRLRAYSQAALVEPEPRLNGGAGELIIPPDFSVTGWTVYEIAKDEGNLMLFRSEIPEPEKRRFLAVTEGASITIDPALLDLLPQEGGRDPKSPISPNMLVTTEDWQIEVRAVQRGARVWEVLQALSSSHKPPPDGMEYALVRVWIRNINADEDYGWVSSGMFRALNAKGETFDRPSIIRFPGEKLDARLFPGGELEGWLALWLPVDDPAVILAFEENIFNKIYFSLQVTEE